MRKVKLGLKVLLGVFFIFGGVMHFINPAFYKPMMPDYIPSPDLMIALSGVTEIVSGIMLLLPKTMVWGAWLIFAQLLAFMTVHVWMIQHAHDRYAKIPLAGLWVRLVFQFVFMAWAYWYTRPEKDTPPA
ncbi:MAG: DoxX family protein [Myxococcales bacterium]|nr:DoxX family protein [Myxococcales bacterium]